MADNTGAPHNLPFPEGTDQPYAHLDIKALAEQVHARLLAVDADLAQRRMDSGNTNVAVASLAAGGANFTAVTFEPGRFTAPPQVALNLQTGAAGTNYLVPRALSITADGFSCYLYNIGTAAIGAGVSSASVGWIARQDY